MEELWFAARTIANVELNMRKYLQNRHIECFVPTASCSPKNKKEETREESLLIKNLIFFKTDFITANALFSLHNRKIFCIRNKNGLITVPEREMEEFMAFINFYGPKIVSSNDIYLIGDRVKIKSGPFAGMNGIVTQIDKKNYFTLVLGGLASLTVRFPKNNLVKVATDVP